MRPVDEASFKQMKAVSHSQAFILMRDIHQRGIFWKDNTAKHKQSRFMQCIDDNFLTKVIKEPIRQGAPLDLMLTSKEETVGSSLSSRDHEMVELRILKKREQGKSKTTALVFRTADSNLFRDLLRRIPWDTQSRQFQASWLIFKDHFFQAQEKSILTNRKSKAGGLNG